MSNFFPVTHSLDPEGIAWITFDDSSARANVFNPATLSALRASLFALATDLAGPGSRIKAVVIISAKQRIFIAGADLKWLAALPDAKAAMQAAREGQAVFDLIAGFNVPVVCAIHGACAGGGYELALACGWRLATDAPETRIGLPEVGLGLIPGWGGCTRLARLIGAQPAVEFILKAALVPAPVALATGLVDELAPAAELRVRAGAAALRLAAGGGPARAVPPAPPPDFFEAQRHIAAGRRRGQLAPLAVLDVVEKSLRLPLAGALELEADRFGTLAAGPAAKNLIRIFLLKEKARKTALAGWYPESARSAPAAPFKMIGIVGAGVMGSGIAYVCAAHGCGVILRDSSREVLDHGVTMIRALFADAVKRDLVTGAAAHRMTGGIGITTSLEDFELCDLVIEAINGDLNEKQKLFAELSAIIGPACVLASNSPVIPMDELTANIVNPGRTIGLHFFKPVSHLALVELALGSHTTDATAERSLAFVKTLGKTAVACRASPGGFVGRVLFFYLNAACQLREKWVPTELIDAAMGDWGWPMGPLRLIDEIGVDVTAAVFGEMKNHFPDRFVASTLCGRMLAQGLKGRENGAGGGFYDYTGGHEVLNPAVAKLVPESPNSQPEWDIKTIEDHLNGVLIDEVRRALAEGVIKTSDDADLALILGIGFPAYRGGLLGWAKEIGR